MKKKRIFVLGAAAFLAVLLPLWLSGTIAQLINGGGYYNYANESTTDTNGDAVYTPTDDDASESADATAESNAEPAVEDEPETTNDDELADENATASNGELADDGVATDNGELAAVALPPAASETPVLTRTAPATLSHESALIIHQLYAGGDTGNNVVSHSFVEIFNPSENPVYLGAYSVQVQTPGDPGAGNEAPPPPIAWDVIPLSGYLQPLASFLIVSDFGASTAENYRTIENWDILVSYEFGNRGISVALVAHQEPLPPFITDSCGVIDLLGALNSGPPRDRTDNYLVTPARISRAQGVRRYNFANTGNNEDDFPSIRYMDLSDDEWERFRPRYTGDGAWVTAIGRRELPGLIINQLHGQGSPGTNAISHGFIELYNPTNTHINLQGLSLQVASGSGLRPFSVLELPNFIMRPFTSFLVVSTEWYNDNTNNPALPIAARARDHAVRHVIENWDMEWYIRLNHNNLVVALVDNTVPLSEEITEAEWYGIIDLVGAHNNAAEDTAHYMGSGPAGNIGRHRSVRRRHLRNTGDNLRDFEQVEFRFPDRDDLPNRDHYDNRPSGMPTQDGGITNIQLELLRPRYSGDGVWRPHIMPLTHVTVLGGYPGYRAYLPRASAGERVRLYAGNPPEGRRFLGWTTSSPGVRIQNPESSIGWSRDNPYGAYFFMFSHLPVTVTANWFTQEPPPELEPAELIINQLHGQGPPGNNAISHGFIEMYNPNDRPVNLEEFSLQVVSGTGVRPWEVLPLPNFYLPPQTSFLVVSTDWYNVNNFPAQGHVPRYIIANYDLGWDLRFDNRNMVVALVRGDVPLSPIISGEEWDTVSDLVGAYNDTDRDAAGTIHHLGSYPARGITRHASVRRRDLQNTQDNYEDFTRIEFRYPTDYPYRRPGVATHANGITATELSETRPRWSGDGPWEPVIPPSHDIAIVGGGEGAHATPNPAPVGRIVRLNAGTPPTQRRFAGWVADEDDVSINNADLRVGATFVMPDREVTVTATWREIPVGANIPLVELTRQESDAAANENNQVRATGGIFEDVSYLTAFSGGIQQDIGYLGTPRAPIAFNNFYPGWRSVNLSVGADHVDHGTTVETATAFQLRFSTAGHENIRFSAQQRSTGSGPDFFALAYRVGSTGAWVSIPGTRTSNRQAPNAFRSNTFEDFNWPGAGTFNEMVLPSAVNDQPIVYLRVYMRESALGYPRRQGNTSINNIEIIGDIVGMETFIVNIEGGGDGAFADPNPAWYAATVTINAGATPPGYRFTYWESGNDDVEIYNPEMQNGATFTMPGDDMTVFANWERLPDGVNHSLVEVHLMNDDVVSADPGNRINATGGIFAAASYLQAVSGNTVVPIGALPDITPSAPITFHNQSNVVHDHLVGVEAGVARNAYGHGWRGVGSSPLDAGITADTASAWQLRFSTLGYETIRFSARQRSTGSGPDRFALAWSTSSTGPFTLIANSDTPVFRGGTGDASVFANNETLSFVEFELPEDLNNLPVVYLRILAYGLTIADRPNGNTSINDIRIIGNDLGATPQPFNIAIIGGGYGAGPESALEDATVRLDAGVAPAGHRFIGWTSDDVDIEYYWQQFNATFTMPAADVTVTAHWELIPLGSDIPLMVLENSARQATPEFLSGDTNGHFNATDGIFSSVSTLTAWNGAARRPIGVTPGTNRAPIVMEGRAGGPTWMAVGHAAAAQNVSTAAEATAFEIAFRTTGFENIRFSARQRSTGSGPQYFALAYRIGTSGNWVSIPGTTTTNRQAPAAYRGNAYTDFNWADSRTFDRFTLPPEVANQETVYLRLYLRGGNAAGVAGNTSINNILIIGDEMMGITGFFAPDILLTNDNLSETLYGFGANATWDFSSLPDGIFATTSGAAITVTATPPAPGEPPIQGTFTIYVTDGDVTKPITVSVNLTPADLPQPNKLPNAIEAEKKSKAAGATRGEYR